ncbi:unnamed protein product [Urochloa humidicola]
MTYNVWCREDVVLFSRMKAIGRLVEMHQPDVICFQEVTPYIHKIFQSFAWWKEYHCSPVTPLDLLATKQPFCLLLSKRPLKNFACWKFANSPTGRCYLEADIHPEPEAAGKTALPIRVATAQLEAPTPPAAMHCMERYVQAEHAVVALGSAENVVFGGDMSWDDNTDLPFPLPTGWVDAWTKIPPPPTSCSDVHYGTTCGGDRIDGVEFRGGSVVGPRKRSDRFVCKLKDYELRSLEVIGRCDQEGAGVKYYSVDRKGYNVQVEFRPSCHYGLVLTIGPVGS